MQKSVALVDFAGSTASRGSGYAPNGIVSASPLERDELLLHDKGRGEPAETKAVSDDLISLGSMVVKARFNLSDLQAVTQDWKQGDNFYKTYDMRGKIHD